MKTIIRCVVMSTIVVTSLVAVTRGQVAGNPPFTLEQAVISSGGGMTADAANVYKLESVIGQPAAGTTSSNASFTLHGGFFAPTAFGPTAGLASVSGRVLTADGLGIRNVDITMTDSNGANRKALSGSFGYFSFEGVEVGEVYILTVRAKQFQFSQSVQAIFVLDSVTDINFIADRF